VLLFVQHLVDEGDGDGSLADGGGDALHVAPAGIADGEDPRMARYNLMRGYLDAVDRYARLAHTFIVNGSMLNEARFGWFKDRQFDSPNQALTPPFGQLTLTVANISNLGISTSYPRLLPSEQRFEYADNFSWTKGRHAMKFGVDVANNQDVTDTLQNRFGSFTYASVTNFALDFTGTTAGGKRWQTFTQAFVVSGGTGGPSDSTLFYTLYLYQRGFNNFDMGYASALAWLMGLIILGFTALVFKSSPLWVFYEAEVKS